MSGPPHYCTETASIEIFVDVIVTIEANNVFTPNGDGVNDFFEIKTTGIKEIEANIYNLWGNKVYKIEKLAGKWDGNTTGQFPHNPGGGRDLVNGFTFHTQTDKEAADLCRGRFARHDQAHDGFHFLTVQITSFRDGLDG